MLRFALVMCIVPIALIQYTTRHTVHTQHFITVIQKVTFRLHETAITISFHISEIKEEIHIAVAIRTTVKTFGHVFTLT